MNDYLERADAVLPGGSLGPYVLPDDGRHVFVRADGVELETTDGATFIDHVGGAGASILGHSHPAVVTAAQAHGTNLCR